MKYLDLLGMHLKNNVLCDLFETYDVQVIYAYDRMHEGFADEFQAEIPDLGLVFLFDNKQVFNTLFIRQVDVDTFNPFEEDNSLMRFNSKTDAMQYATNHGIQITEGKVDFMGELRDWIRFEFGNYSIHYEYVQSKLHMITLQAQNA